MRKWNYKKLYLVLILILPILLVGLLNSSKMIIAQPQYDKQTQTCTIPLNFSLYEFATDSKSEQNKTSINLELPSSNWNLTDLQVNFTDIEFNRENKVIEETPDSSNYVDRLTIKGLTVQITINDPTILYGVQIYGRAINPRAADELTVELQGYDNADNHPNGTILKQVELNMSTDLQWYTQKFDSSILLSKGNYSLIMTKSTIQLSSTRYLWHYNYLNPNHPELYVSSEPLIGGWVTGYNGTPYLYKLDQKLSFNFKPQDIDMSAEINSNSHPVLNGIDPTKANLTISNVNYASTTNYLPISVENNRSSPLLFNATYTFRLKSIFTSLGTLSIRETFNNSWSITPCITRVSTNYSIKFEYPDSWDNLTVYKNGIPTSEDIIIDDEAVYILNDTITPASTWNITANSEKINFDATPQLTSYTPGQTLRITLDIPPLAESSNLTFIILDRDGYFEDEILENYITTTSYIFEYEISLNAIGGYWNAFVFWNNLTDAGLEIVTFQVTVSDGGNGDGKKDTTTIITGLDPQQVFIIVVIIIIGVVGALTSYQVVKKHNIKKVQYRQKIYNKYMDTLNLNYIMISDKRSGLNIYEQFISGKKMDPTLVSGFLQAIKTFGIELTGSEEQSQSLSLDFQKSKILMSEFKDFRIINIFEESPSKDFMDSLKPLSIDIDKYYGKSIKNFDGNVSIFKGMKELLERHLLVSLVYPLKVYEPKTLKLDAVENNLVKKALDVMKKKNSDYFYVSYLLSEKEYNIKSAEKILQLIEKKVFRPVE